MPLPEAVQATVSPTLIGRVGWLFNGSPETAVGLLTAIIAARTARREALLAP